MAYIGNRPEQGNFRKCDAITTSATATYNLLVGGVAVNPNQNQCIVSLNGVIQSSGNSYTIASSQITFASTLASSDVIDFILILGDTLDVGTVSDDTISTAKIQANAVTFDKTSGVVRPNVSPLLMNGNFAIAQRGASKATIGNEYGTCDRWYSNTQVGAFTQSQDTDVPSGYGFANSLKMDCTTSASPSSGQRNYIQQRFEGQDLQLFKKGTSNAEIITLSFWVKSVKTGTYIIEVQDVDNSRQISKSYTISSASTWEKKIISFAGDTTGALGDDNGRSFDIAWYLSAGSDYTSGTLSTSWSSVTNANRAVGQVNLADNTNNNFWLTGVQLEVGEYTSATLPPFQQETYGDNLERCERYYQVIGTGTRADNKMYYSAYNVDGTSTMFGTFNFRTTMRAEPSLDQTSGTNYYTFNCNNASDDFDGVNGIRGGIHGTLLYLSGGSSVGSSNAGMGGSVLGKDASSHVALSAEL